jgi:type II secretion system protein I
MKRALLFRRRHARGFSLLETMIAGAIFLVAMLGVVSAVGTATAQYQHQRNATIALQVAERTMEELLLEYSTSSELNEGGHTRGYDVNGEPTAAAQPRFVASWVITPNMPVSTSRRIDLGVTWTDKSNGIVKLVSYRP